MGSWTDRYLLRKFPPVCKFLVNRLIFCVTFSNGSNECITENNPAQFVSSRCAAPRPKHAGSVPEKDSMPSSLYCPRPFPTFSPWLPGHLWTNGLFLALGLPGKSGLGCMAALLGSTDPALPSTAALQLSRGHGSGRGSKAQSEQIWPKHPPRAPTHVLVLYLLLWWPPAPLLLTVRPGMTAGPAGPAGLCSTRGSWGEISDLFPLCSNSSPSGFLHRPISCSENPALPVYSLDCEHKRHSVTPRCGMHSAVLCASSPWQIFLLRSWLQCHHPYHHWPPLGLSTVHPCVCILGYSYHWDTVIIPGDLLLNPCHTHTRTEHEGCITRALLTVSYTLSEILGK